MRKLMTGPYNKYKGTEEWHLIAKAIEDLVNNQDIEITTQPDYVIGYITKSLKDKKAEGVDNEEVQP